MHVPGSIIGNRYQIIQKLGREEIRETYLAKDLQATGDARCAVEQLNPAYKDEADWQVVNQLLINEMEVLKRLGDHPQIPQFYNYFVEEEEFYFVREYIDGNNLEQEVTGKILDEAETIYLIQDVLRILDFLHKTNVIHCDIQPIHLVRSKNNNNFILVNFSAIRELESTRLNPQKQLSIKQSNGNWVYTAPEQKQGTEYFCSDIYALGKTAVYALTGRSPQELDKTNTSWQSQCSISSKLQTVLEKMMQLSLQERYNSAIEVLQDLRPLLKIKQVVGGRYAIKGYLGGKEGIESYLADNLHRQYQSPCLVKQIKLSEQQKNGKIKIERRFAEELSILERLGFHEQIPQLWDHFAENDEFYLVQEYIPGQNLAYKIGQQDLTIVEIIQVLEKTLSVLNFIHHNRIIHRNIKPSNLLISQENRQVIITDFGILQDIQALSSDVITANQDKNNYCSPEQVAGRPTISSDIYALGMTIIEALTNTKPETFPRDKATGKLLWQQSNGRIIDRRLTRIIDRMIHLDLGQRYQSANKVLSDLQKVKISNPDKSKINQQPRQKTIIRQTRRRPSSFKMPKFGLLIGLLGIICVLGSIEFAFPVVRPLYYWHRGTSLLKENPQSALDSFMQAIDIKPQSEPAWSGRGDAAFSLGNYADALAAYAEAAELNPNNFKNWLKQGDSLHKLQQFQSAIAAYDRALELEMNDGELYNHRGKVLYELQNYDDALVMQDTAIDTTKDTNSFNPEFLSDRGKNLLALGRYDDALSMFNRVQAAEPGKVQLWQDKSLVLSALERPQEAARVNNEVLNSYNQILQKQPRDTKAWLAQANFLTQIAKFSKAIIAYNQVIELDPNSAQAWLGKGRAFAQLDQSKAALSALDQALQISPESYLTWQALGKIYQNNLNNLSQALASYDRGIAVNSSYAPLWRDRGIALNQQGNYTRGIESLIKASEIAPKDRMNWIVLASAWDKIGQDKKALIALDRALEIQPQDPEIWSQKGLIYTKNQQYNEACQTYRESLVAISDPSTIMVSMRTLGCRLN